LLSDRAAVADRARSVIPTREERPPESRRRRADIAADEFVEFIEALIRTMDSADGRNSESDGDDVIEVETCPTEPMEYLDEPPPALPRAKVLTEPPPFTRHTADDLSFESDVELIEDSLIDTEELSWSE
jgi:hypothetical protein